MQIAETCAYHEEIAGFPRIWKNILIFILMSEAMI